MVLVGSSCFVFVFKKVQPASVARRLARRAIWDPSIYSRILLVLH